MVHSFIFASACLYLTMFHVISVMYVSSAYLHFRRVASARSMVRGTERGLEVEEMNVDDVVQEIVEITLHSEAAPERMDGLKEGRHENNGDEDGEVGGSMRLSETC